MVLLVVGSMVSGVTVAAQGWPATVVAAGAIGATVITGSSYGLYLALVVVATGGLVADGGPTRAELVALVVTLLVVHEVTRFSLDARRPSRFGSGLIGRYAARTGAAALALAVIALAAGPVADRSPTDDLWIPVGMVGATIPLFALFAAGRLPAVPALDGLALRVGVGVVATAALITLVVIGAQARGQITSSTVDPGQAQVAGPTTTTTTPVEQDRSTTAREVESWMVVLTVGLIAAFIYFMLRKPEATFDLEDVEQPAEGNALDLMVGGLAETDAEMISLDEDTLARLLADLQLDIAAERDPGRAIRFGYAQVEQRLADLGLGRADAETEREFLERAMRPLGVAATAMATLTELFERARFGHDPVDEAMRAQALEAIDALIAATAATAATDADRPGGMAGPNRRSMP